MSEKILLVWIACYSSCIRRYVECSDKWEIIHFVLLLNYYLLDKFFGKAKIWIFPFNHDFKFLKGYVLCLIITLIYQTLFYFDFVFLIINNKVYKYSHHWYVNIIDWHKSNLRFFLFFHFLIMILLNPFLLHVFWNILSGKKNQSQTYNTFKLYF